MAVQDEVQIELPGDGVEPTHRVGTGHGRRFAGPVQVPVVLLGQGRGVAAGFGQEDLDVVVRALGGECRGVVVAAAEGAELLTAQGDPTHPRCHVHRAEHGQAPQDDGQGDAGRGRRHRHGELLPDGTGRTFGRARRCWYG